jgi:hypothetical protein
MTYPPQQPGPYGPQDPYGQQNPYGQQPQYGAPQYGAPQWGQQPGYPSGPPPKKSRTGLIVTLVIVALLVVGGGIAAFLLLKDDGNAGGNGGGGGEGTPRAAADAYTRELGTAVSSKPADASLDEVKPLMCADDYDKLNDELQDAKKDKDEASELPEKTTFTISGFKEEGDGATFDMVQKRGDQERDSLKMDVTKEDGNWVVCGIYNESEDSPEDGTDTTSRGSEDDDGPASSGSIPNPIPKSSN